MTTRDQIEAIIADARRECLAECGSNDDATVMRRLAAKLFLMAQGTSGGFLRAGLDPRRIGKPADGPAAASEL